MRSTFDRKLALDILTQISEAIQKVKIRCLRKPYPFIRILIVISLHVIKKLFHHKNTKFILDVYPQSLSCHKKPKWERLAAAKLNDRGCKQLPQSIPFVPSR